MLALPGGAQIAGSGLGCGFAVEAGVLVVGVAHAGCGPFREHGVEQSA